MYSAYLAFRCLRLWVHPLAVSMFLDINPTLVFIAVRHLFTLNFLQNSNQTNTFQTSIALINLIKLGWFLMENKSVSQPAETYETVVGKKSHILHWIEINICVFWESLGEYKMNIEINMYIVATTAQCRFESKCSISQVGRASSGEESQIWLENKGQGTSGGCETCIRPIHLYVHRKNPTLWPEAKISSKWTSYRVWTVFYFESWRLVKGILGRWLLAISDIRTYRLWSKMTVLGTIVRSEVCNASRFCLES